MKVRIGVGTSGAGASPDGLGDVVDAVDALGFDSLWLSEVLTGATFDPLVALAWAGARAPRLKLGTTMLVPGRNVLRLAKQVSTLDVLSGGRLLLTFVPGLTRSPEREAIGVAPQRRGATIEEVLPLLRRLWAGERVTTDAPVAGVELVGVTLDPLPVQQPLEVWLGGMAPAALERCGRLSDGWLPSLCTPEEAAAGKVAIDRAAQEAGRSIDPEHFGLSLSYARAPLGDEAARALAARSRGPRPEDLVPVGRDALRRRIEAFVDVGFSKFVVRPLEPPASWPAALEELAGDVAGLQS